MIPFVVIIVVALVRVVVTRIAVVVVVVVIAVVIEIVAVVEVVVLFAGVVMVAAAITAVDVVIIFGVGDEQKVTKKKRKMIGRVCLVWIERMVRIGVAVNTCHFLLKIISVFQQTQVSLLVKLTIICYEGCQWV